MFRALKMHFNEALPNNNHARATLILAFVNPAMKNLDFASPVSVIYHRCT